MDLTGSVAWICSRHCVRDRLQGHARGSRKKHRKAAAIALARVRAHQARKRLDFLHKESAKIAGANALVAMEKLAIRNMTRSAAGTVEAPGTHVAQKAGLNREILDTAPALLMSLIHYKVLETGGDWAQAPTRTLKPSQTCPGCGKRVKKLLSLRVHECAVCGLKEDRDRASAQVVLNWAMYGKPTAPKDQQARNWPRQRVHPLCETPSN